MKGTHRILAVIVVALLAVAIADSFPKESGGQSKPEKPALWGLTDPPVLNNSSWRTVDGVQLTELPLNLSNELNYQLWALGYYPVYANWSDCRWTIWEGRKAYYVGKTKDGILVVRGDLKAVVEWVNETSKCGKPGWETAVIGPSPEKALSYTASLIGDALEKEGLVVVPGEWNGTVPWNLENATLRAGDVTMLVLVYATRGQAEYARFLVGGRTLCISSLGYYSLIVLTGPPGQVMDVYDAIRKVAENRNGLVFG